MTQTELKVLFQRPLHNLGENGDSALEGIFSPTYDESVINRFMTGHYANKDSAQAQADSMSGMYEYYRTMLTTHVINTGKIADPNAKLKILEIGCGFGSATRPLLTLFPNSQVVATELSLSMLSILRSYIKGSEYESRCSVMQLNAEELSFGAGSFDLVVGAAILHHLFEPHKVIEQCAKVLKPGGIAVFFEPYEAGMAVVAMIYQMIERDPRSWILNRKFQNYLRNTLRAWQAIGTKPKSDVFFQTIDDKWFFTRPYFETHAKSFGFNKTSIVSLSQSNTPFKELVRVHFEGNGMLPYAKSWIWDLVDRVEQSMSRELKQELATEVCVILER